MVLFAAVLSLFCLLQGEAFFHTPVNPGARASHPSLYRRYSIAQEKEAASETCRTFEILRKLGQQNDKSGGAGSSIDVEGLKRLDAVWSSVRNMPSDVGPAPTFVREREAPLVAPQFDVVVAGGTLGIFVACVLQLRGFKVCVVERGVVEGRKQEWNIDRPALLQFVKLGAITEEELEEIIGITFNPIRVGFLGEDGPYELLTKDVLNLGIYPSVLIAKAKARFEKAGGVVRERAGLQGVEVAPNGVLLKLSSDRGEDEDVTISGRLLIDCMGNASPIVRQTRWGQRPDGVCIVVGTMAAGYAPENNTMADLIYTNVPTLSKGKDRAGCQWFWEAFPASTAPDERTTYLFQYVDSAPERPSILECWEDYWELLEDYQGRPLDQLTIKRAVCQFFPTYFNSPLPTKYDRICQMGDASGIQSPLSFGGLAGLARHMPRLCDAFTEALKADCLTKDDLGLINSYQPSLSTTWMFQRAMSVPVGRSKPLHPFFINRGLINTFRSMDKLGDPVLKPFLQDVVQAIPLAKTLFGVLLEDPFNTPRVLLHVGPSAFFSWFYHYTNLLLYTLGHNLLKGTKDSTVLGEGRLRYRWRRILELLEFGSGMDYVYEE